MWCTQTQRLRSRCQQDTAHALEPLVLPRVRARVAWRGCGPLQLVESIHARGGHKAAETSRADDVVTCGKRSVYEDGEQGGHPSGGWACKGQVRADGWGAQKHERACGNLLHRGEAMRFPGLSAPRRTRVGPPQGCTTPPPRPCRRLTAPMWGRLGEHQRLPDGQRRAAWLHALVRPPHQWLVRLARQQPARAAHGLQSLHKMGMTRTDTRDGRGPTQTQGDTNPPRNVPRDDCFSSATYSSKNGRFAFASAKNFLDASLIFLGFFTRSASRRGIKVRYTCVRL